MWLINTTTLELESFQGCPADTYAILSHTWGTDAQELTFDEFKAGEGRQKDGFWKIQKCCEQAREDDLKYAWVDTCCIDKRSSTELTEAINSMFIWYARAKICYVYLADVSQYDPLHGHKDAGSFVGSRWFGRGWTLQELIAPQILSFYNCDWMLIGDKQELTEPLLVATGIRADVLTQEKNFQDCSVAQRMSWASNRKTTREEDIAYCLLGLFGVNMPLLYGESSQAFIRLQETIIQETDDETIFAWAGVDEGGCGLLASSPANFAQSADIELIERREERATYEKTNRGLRIQFKMLPCEMNTNVVLLQCERRQANSGAQQIAIFLCKTVTNNQHRRIPLHGKCIDESRNWQTSKAMISTIFVPNSANNVELAPHLGFPVIRVKSNLHAWQFPKASSHRFPHESLEDWTAACDNPAEFWPRFAASEPDMVHRREVGDSARNQPLPGLAVGEDKEAQHESTTDYPTEYGSEAYRWAPKKVQRAVRFRSHHLETGILIAFTRSASWEGTFHYYLELGFDPCFKPVCILHTTRIIGRTTIRLVQLVDMGKAPRYAAGEYLPGSLHKLFDSIRIFKIHVCDSYWPDARPLDWSPWVYGRGTQSPRNLLNATGSSQDGLRITVTGEKSPEFDLVEVRVALRPLRGLEWELLFEEGCPPGLGRMKIFLNWVKPGVPFVRLFMKTIEVFCVGGITTILAGWIFSSILNISPIAGIGLIATITVGSIIEVFFWWLISTGIRWNDKKKTHKKYVQINDGEKEEIT